MRNCKVQSFDNPSKVEHSKQHKLSEWFMICQEVFTVRLITYSVIRYARYCIVLTVTVTKGTKILAKIKRIYYKYSE